MRMQSEQSTQAGSGDDELLVSGGKQARADGPWAGMPQTSPKSWMRVGGASH